MLNEYGVDPACLSNWQNFRFLMGGFGVSQGRLISQFPKDWVRRVCDVCESFSFIQRQKMEVELLRIKKHALIRSGRNYDGGKEWLENAILQHKFKPFKAVITNDHQVDLDCILVAEDIASQTSLWAVEREWKVHRTVEALVNAIAPLLRISSRILFVDKMFHPATDRWRDVLAQMLNIACDGQEKRPTFEYHCKIEGEEICRPEELRKTDFQNKCERYLLDMLPPKASLTVFRWDQLHKGDFFHDRYVLTDKGGVRVGWGLDRGKSGETTDVCLLDDSMHSARLNDFRPETSQYKLIDMTTVARTD